MFLMIDNYDSFVYNLVSYFLEENIKMEIIRNDKRKKIGGDYNFSWTKKS